MGHHGIPQVLIQVCRPIPHPSVEHNIITCVFDNATFLEVHNDGESPFGNHPQLFVRSIVQIDHYQARRHSTCVDQHTQSFQKNVHHPDSDPPLIIFFFYAE
jgi:hypothetical protein